MTHHLSHKYFQFEFCSSQWVDTELQVYYCIFIISQLFVIIQLIFIGGQAMSFATFLHL